MFGAPAITCIPRARAAFAAIIDTGNSLIRIPSRWFSSISSSVRSSWLARITPDPAMRASKRWRLTSRIRARWACSSTIRRSTVAAAIPSRCRIARYRSKSAYCPTPGEWSIKLTIRTNR